MRLVWVRWVWWLRVWLRRSVNGWRGSSPAAGTAAANPCSRVKPQVMVGEAGAAAKPTYCVRCGIPHHGKCLREPDSWKADE